MVSEVNKIYVLSNKVINGCLIEYYVPIWEVQIYIEAKQNIRRTWAPWKQESDHRSFGRVGI